MRKLMLSMAAMPLLVGGLSVSASADGINVLDDLQLKGEIRPRYEYADVKDNANEAANAYTARTKLSVSGKLMGVEGLSANVGVISVNNFGVHTYNPADGHTYTTSSGKPYDKVVDPQYAMISNAEINYKMGKTLFHAGRGQVNLDNQRFIGTVGWRQLERSYDTVFVADSTIPNLNLLAAWVYGFQGVKAGETTDTNTVLLHAAYKVMDPLTVTAYDYMIANAFDIYGVALTGKVDMGAKLSYRLEYAHESDNTMKMHGADANNVNANYFNIDVTANVSGLIVGANYEFMSGDDTADGENNTFISPLGTNHKFNGWADVYLGGNAGTGLIDMNAKVGYKAKGLGKVLAVYHKFVADKDIAGKDDMGSEIDLLYANKVPGVNNLKGLVKGAFFKGGDIGQTSDVTKFWVMLDYKFTVK